MKGKWLFAASLCLTSVQAHSIEAVQDDFPDSTGSEFESAFLDSNATISSWFYEMADGLDLFLAGERITNKKNNTSARLEGNYTVKESQEPTSSANFNVNLRLPNIEEYWNLKFTSYDETKDKRIADKTRAKRAAKDQDFGASVGFFQKIGKIRTAFQPRVSFTNSLKLSHSLVFESILSEPSFQVNPKLEFYGNSDVGTGVFIALNFFIPYTKIWSLTLINDGDYVSKTHKFSASNGFSVRQTMSETYSLTYALIFDSNNKTNYHLDSYTFSISWNHNIYKKIIDYSVTPYVEHVSLNNFKPTGGLSMGLGINF